MGMCKSKSFNADVHIESSPAEAPVGILVRCLFGISVNALAQEIVLNKDGKWDEVYTG